MLWTWNPRNSFDATDNMFRGPEIPTGSVVIRANWRDNPWFTAELEQERLDCLRMQPDQYSNIWEGDYVTVVAGAYYAAQINKAREDRRIGRVGPDPLMRFRVFCDLGGSGARADAFTMWVCQFVERSILVLNYYEAQGQTMGTHARWLESFGYKPGNTDIWLPHDGDTSSGPIDSSWKKEFDKLGYNTDVIQNQGKGAAMQRVKEGRQRFPLCWFHEETTKAGLAALGWYHGKKDEARGIDLGPEHDWSSHGADAFGLMCCAYEEPRSSAPLVYPKMSFA
jgi:phage terminase large subunit